MQEKAIWAQPEHTIKQAGILPACCFFPMFYTTIFAIVLIIVILAKYLYKPVERCPECNTPRESDHPICPCGYVFEFPEDDDPLEYGDPEDSVKESP